MSNLTYEPIVAVGVMSGTSLDGIDVVKVRTDGADVCEVQGHFYKEYAPELRGALAVVARGDIPLSDLLRLERHLSEAYVDALSESGFTADAGVIGVHGQSIRHLPKEGLTWQLGDANFMAEKLGIPVVGDFRRRDMAAGGEGAPLVPLFHAMMLRSKGIKVGSILNIGGVSNVTVVDADGAVKASDCGPGVGLLNTWVKQMAGVEFDKEGEFALNGIVDGGVVARALKEIEFWQRALPRSADRYDFEKVLGWLEGKSLEDGAATLAALTSHAVLDCLEGLGATGPLYVAGGGARNKAILGGLIGHDVRPVKELGWNEQAVEAACFGWLAVRRLRGLGDEHAGDDALRAGDRGWGTYCVNPVNAVALGVLVALALKRKNGRDNLDIWRWIAGATGALFPYSEVFLFFMGEGIWAQGSRALLWTLMVMPISAVGIAGVLGVMTRKSWEEYFCPVVGGLGAAWVLGALTERGIFPLALLWDYRLSFGVLDTVDVILLGICLVGLGMVYAFKIYDRDLARLTMAGVIGYVVLVGVWSVQAREFGEHYAKMQEMKSFRVTVEPQALSPLNWRVTVVEFSGKVHDTLITLGRGAGHKDVEREGPYKSRDEAVWKVYKRYGDEAVVDEVTQRQIRRAWYGWQVTAFGWMGRYAVFERMYEPQEAGLGVGCMGFKDIRDTVEAEEGTFVVCPWRDRVRVLMPDGAQDKKGNWLGFHELVAYQGVR